MRTETIPCKVRERKGVTRIMPRRPLHLGPGDRSEVVRQDGRMVVVVYRAGFFKRIQAKLRGE